MMVLALTHAHDKAIQATKQQFETKSPAYSCSEEVNKSDNLNCLSKQY